MSVTSRPTGDEAGDPLAALESESQPAVGGGSLLGGPGTDRCSECGAELAADQRYCVECGTRRGRPRFTLPAGAAAAGAQPAAVAAQQPFNRSPLGGPMLLLALVAVLVALGIGVLIGNATSTITVRVAGATTTTGPSGASSPTSSTSSGGGATGTGSSGGTSTGTGSTGSSSSTPKVGSKCTNGTPGCQNGKFTGNFFGN